MMMSSVHHLGDAVLMAPHRAKQAREPFLAPGRGSFLEREARARAERRDSGVSHVGGSGDPALSSTSRHTPIAESYSIQ